MPLFKVFGENSLHEWCDRSIIWCKNIIVSLAIFLPNSGPAPSCWKINTWEAAVGKKENCLWSESWQSEEMVDSVSPRNHLWRVCSAMKVFKGKRGSSIGELLRRGAEPSSSPTACRLVDFLWAFFGCSLVHIVCSRDYWKVNSEEIWSYDNCLFIIPTSLIYGKNQQVRQAIIWTKDLTGVFRPGWTELRGTWFKSYNVALLN